jgi:cyclase
MVADPTVLTACAERFGAQCVVASIDAKLDDDGAWRVWTHGGRTKTSLEAVAWAQECVERGAGEVLLTSIDRDGARTGYDLPLMRAVSSTVSAPVIASGGAGNASHIVEVLAEGHADAALVAGILHDNVTTVGALKDAMRASGLVVR